LLAQGHEVLVLDYASRAANSHTNYLGVDIRNFRQLVDGLKGCEAIIHLAIARDTPVYVDNTTSSFNVLRAAIALNIERICLASSVAAIGDSAPRYDYFPVDERHPCYAKDEYGLSKWVLEQQAHAIARRYPQMRIASLRFHRLVSNRAAAIEFVDRHADSAKQLWSYTLLQEAGR